MYLVLGRIGAGRWIDDGPFIKGVSFIRGARIAQTLPDPLEFTLKPLNPAADDHGPRMPEFLESRYPLFRIDFIEALREVGVDNIDYYNAAITDPDSGQVHRNFKAANIIGTIAAADMARSDATIQPGGPIIDVEFDTLVVDEAKARGALMFRLAESLSTILVRDSVRDRLVQRGFDMLAFFEPEDSFV